MAADGAAELGLRTLLLEKNRKPGVKILISGGTRCNLTHHTDAAGILSAFGEQQKFLRHAVRDFPPSRIVEYFHGLGVATKIEPNGKVFPASDRLYDVQQACGIDCAHSGRKRTWVAPSRVCRNSVSCGKLVNPKSITRDNCSSPPGAVPTQAAERRATAMRGCVQLGHTILEPRPAAVATHLSRRLGP